MENRPSFEVKEGAPITPESVLTEIRSRFSDSRELYNHVKERVDNNFAARIDRPKTPQEAADDVIQRLASIRQEGTMLFGKNSGRTDEDITLEDAKQSFTSGALLGLLTGAIYHGEATLIGNEGEVLRKAIPMGS